MFPEDVLPFVVMIILIMTTGNVLKHIIRPKQKYLPPEQNSEQASRIRDLEKHSRQLEDRIQVLERIATDQKSDLKRSIDALG